MDTRQTINIIYKYFPSPIYLLYNKNYQNPYIPMAILIA